MLSQRSRIAFHATVTTITCVLGIASARADIAVSSKPTANMSCVSGVCTATAKKAVLNVGDLTAMLASGDVTIASGTIAQDIAIDAAVSWTSPNRLTLDSYRAIAFHKPVMVVGTGAMTITTNNGGTGGDFVFSGKGSIRFWDLSSSLVINGNGYTLVKTLRTLKAAIRANSAGLYALADSSNAKKYGVFDKAPIKRLDGTVEGLGNTISNLSINVGKHVAVAGLFADNHGTIRDLGLIDASVEAHGRNENTVGGLVAENFGTISGSYITGEVTSGATTLGVAQTDAGGLVGINGGMIIGSHSSATVTAVPGGDGPYFTGGLAGTMHFDQAQIYRSFATGAVSGAGAGPSNAGTGGLVGDGTYGVIEQSYATGNVGGPNNETGGLVGAGGGRIGNSYATGSVAGVWAGGLAGAGDGNGIFTSYSTGAVSGSRLTGGLVGEDSNKTASNCYWDLETSGVSNQSQGAGNPANDPGITGLTTAQLQSGLPAGFNPTIWGQKANINGGLPYLLALPPT